MQRFFLALHATVPAALTVAVLVHLWGPAGLPPLSQRPVWSVWVLIGAWLLMSALAAWALRTLTLWRVALGGGGALLALAAVAGLVLRSALAPAMALGLATVGLACAGMAGFIGPQRVHGNRRKTARPSGTTAAAPKQYPMHWRVWQHATAQVAHLPFWLCGVLAVESFRLAHIVAAEPARSSGMLGLLLTFFVALPAATLRHWAPRTTAALWLLAAGAYGGLAAKAGLWQWATAAALCALAAAVPWLWTLRQPARRAAGSTTSPAAAAQHPTEAA